MYMVYAVVQAGCQDIQRFLSDGLSRLSAISYNRLTLFSFFRGFNEDLMKNIKICCF